VLCGRLAAEAALAREESRGAHYRADFPQPREAWRRHLVFRADAAGVATAVAPDAAALR
jgi:L-aspartate oxidase